MNLSNPLRLSVLAAALAFSPFVPSIASAQDAAPPATRPARGQFNPAAGLERYEKAIAELKLTDEQKPKVDEAVAKAKKEMAALVATPPTGEGRERFAPYQKVTTDLREAVNGVLTEEQKKEFAEKTRMGRGGPGGQGGPGAGGPGGGMQRMLTELGLTEEQNTKVKVIMEESQKKSAALREAGGEAEERREKARAIREEQQKAIDAVLTPEQKEKLAKLREAQPQGGQRGQGRRGAQQPL